MPIFECSYNNSMKWSQCSSATVCSGNSNLQYHVDYDSNLTIQNWITSMNLEWLSKFKLGLFGSLYFVGFWFGSLTLLRLGDIYGRKPICLITSISLLIVYLMFFFVENLYLIYFFLFVWGTLGIARGSLFYIYLLELIPEDKRSKYSWILMIFEGLMGIFNTGLVYLIGDVKKVMIIIFGMSLAHLIFVIFTPESPKFLYSVNKIKEMNESLNSIASINGTTFPEDDKIDEDNSTTSNSNVKIASFIEELKNSLYRNNLMIMALNWCAWSLSFYIIGYYVGKFPGNLYINAFAMGAADTLSASVSNIFIGKLGFKFGFTFMFILVVLVTTLYALFNDIPVIEYLWVFSMRLGIWLCFVMWYFGNSEYFETKVKARSFAFWNFFARIFTILSPLIVTLFPYPIFVITGFTTIASITSLFLVHPSTVNKSSV